MANSTIFVSYSHKDTDAVKLVLAALHQVGERRGFDITPWSDFDLMVGDDWYHRLFQKMDNCSSAVLVVSDAFLNSSFCRREEVPYLLQLKRSKGLPIFPLLLSEANWPEEPWLASIQVFSRGGAPILTLDKDAITDALHEFAENATNLTHTSEKEAAARVPYPIPTRCNLDNLSASGNKLLGRSDAIRDLTHCIRTTSVPFVALSGPAGSGKTTLLHALLEDADDWNYWGISTIYGHSFDQTTYSGGNADSFLSKLCQFLEVDAESGSSLARAKRAAEELSSTKSLLILDSCDALAETAPNVSPRIKDLAFVEFLYECSLRGNVTCLLTIRDATLLPAFIYDHKYHHIGLDDISIDTSAGLLRVSGARGSDLALRDLAARFGNDLLRVTIFSRVVLYRSPQGWDSSKVAAQAAYCRDDSGFANWIMSEVLEPAEVEALQLYFAFPNGANNQQICSVANLTRLDFAFPRATDTDLTDALSALEEKGLLSRRRRSPTDPYFCHLRIRSLLEGIHGVYIDAEDRQRQSSASVASSILSTLPKPPETLEQILHAYEAAKAFIRSGCRAHAIIRVYQPLIRQIISSSVALKKYGLLSQELDFLGYFFTGDFQSIANGATENTADAPLREVITIVGAESLLLGEAAFCLNRLGYSEKAFDLALQRRSYTEVIVELGEGKLLLEKNGAAPARHSIWERLWGWHKKQHPFETALKKTIGTEEDYRINHAISRIRLAAIGFNCGTVRNAAGESLKALELFASSNAEGWQIGEAFAQYAYISHEGLSERTSSFLIDSSRKQITIFPHISNPSWDQTHEVYRAILIARRFSVRIDDTYLGAGIPEISAGIGYHRMNQDEIVLCHHTMAWYFLAILSTSDVLPTLLGYWGLKLVQQHVADRQYDAAVNRSKAMQDIWAMFPEETRHTDATAYHALAWAYARTALALQTKNRELQTQAEQEFQIALSLLRECGDYVEFVSALMAEVGFNLDSGHIDTAEAKFQRIERYASGVICERLRRELLLLELRLSQARGRKPSNDLIIRTNHLLETLISDGPLLIFNKLSEFAGNLGK